MNKQKAKSVAAAAGVPVTEHRIASRLEAAREPHAAAALCREADRRRLLLRRHHRARKASRIRRNRWRATSGRFGEDVMVERYVAGRELTCAVRGDEALGVTEIIPIGHGFYDYDAKYAAGGSKHLCPAPVKPFVYQNIQRLALEAHRAIGCRGVSRSDFRYDEAGTGELIWPRGQHAARHDAHIAGSGDRRPRRAEFPGTGGLDGGGRVVPTIAIKAGGGSARIAALDRALGRLSRPLVERLPRRLRRAAERIERRRGGGRGQLAAAGFLLASVFYGLVAGGHIGRVADSALVLLGLGIETVQVSGDAATPEAAILDELQPRGSLLNFDIESAQNRIAELPWVAEATIRKFFPNTLSVNVSERTPFALWQRNGQVYVIDQAGKEIAPLQDPRYGKLPFIVGDEANRAAANLFAEINAQPAVAERLRSAVFVGARRGTCTSMTD